MEPVSSNGTAHTDRVSCVHEVISYANQWYNGRRDQPASVTWPVLRCRLTLFHWLNDHRLSSANTFLLSQPIDCAGPWHEPSFSLTCQGTFYGESVIFSASNVVFLQGQRSLDPWHLIMDPCYGYIIVDRLLKSHILFKDWWIPW